MSEKPDVLKQNNCNGSSDLTNSQSSQENQSGQSNHQATQNVRYIPITLDYGDKTTVNTDSKKSNEQSTSTNTTTNTKPSPRYQHPNHYSNDPPKPTSIFDRVKHFPVNLRSTQRNESPGRTIPITVQSECAKGGSQPTQPATNQLGNQPNTHDEVDYHSSPPPPPPPPQLDEKLNADANAIVKIQKIQQEIQHLMDRVDKFNGTRKDKDYRYIDEMLTQNLLKLDTIDTDGKDKIKQARREAIKCINTCISVLEAKSEAALENEKSQAKTQN